MGDRCAVADGDDDVFAICHGRFSIYHHPNTGNGTARRKASGEGRLEVGADPAAKSLPFPDTPITSPIADRKKKLTCASEDLSD